ncbi:hypothetical protein BDZ94DRAFT_1247154 [Collybia nuda]|uniref:Uncharacterized protein n=1 Tax=Collybia nuda TaxID=64659 RepID=A0A9P5YGA7_9AGAR|nr:hypothetical protein BDZ94DRAFT_1247154 [Collybia nuda]
MHADTVDSMAVDEEDEDSLFGSPPPTPIRGRSPSPTLALPSASSSAQNPRRRVTLIWGNLLDLWPHLKQFKGQILTWSKCTSLHHLPALPGLVVLQQTLMSGQ